jgi:hypothetical protein
MDNKVTLDKFLQFFWASKLHNKISFLPLNLKYPQKQTPSFLISIRNIILKIECKEELNNQLDIYLESQNDDDLQKLNNSIDYYLNIIKKDISNIPNDITKSYCALLALINIGDYNNDFQIYDALILLKKEVDKPLIKKIVSSWKQNKIQKNDQEIDYKHWTSLTREEIDYVSICRFNEVFKIGEFDRVSKSLEKELNQIFEENYMHADIDEGHFFVWLLNRIPEFFKEFHSLNRYLEYLIETQENEGYWRNYRVVYNFDDTKTGKDVIKTALFSLNILKMSNSKNYSQKGVLGAKWLLENQNHNGSWSIELMTNNKVVQKESLFVTIIALEVLVRSGIPNIDCSVELAHDWIMENQNELGMWQDDLFNFSFSFMTVIVLELNNFLKNPTKFTENLVNHETINEKPYLEIEKVPDDFYRQLIDLINECYSKEIYPAVPIFCRKLLESLIIDILKKKYGQKNIDIFYNKSYRQYKSFNSLLKELEDNIDDFKIDMPSIDKKFISSISKFREKGNTEAHVLELDFEKYKYELDKDRNEISHTVKKLIRLLKYLIADSKDKS